MMLRAVGVLICSVMLTGCAFDSGSRDVDLNGNVNAFKILQSEDSTSTYLLKDATGDVWLLLVGNTEPQWQRVAIKKPPVVEKPIEGRFQLVGKISPSQHMVLLDTLNGASWVLKTEYKDFRTEQARVETWFEPVAVPK